jgi:hypothetical protein
LILAVGLDNPTKLLAHLDKRACWDQHKQGRIGRLHSIAERCLGRVARAAPSGLWSSSLSSVEEVRRSTEALQALEAERAVGPLVEAEATEKECCICLKAEEVGKLLSLVPYGHRCVCADYSALVTVSRTYLLSGMPNGSQTGDPCVQLTFPRRTGLAGSLGRRIVMMQFGHLRSRATSWSADVSRPNHG